MKNLYKNFNLYNPNPKGREQEYIGIAECDAYTGASTIDYDEDTNTVVLGYTKDQLKKEIFINYGKFPPNNTWKDMETNEVIFNIKVITVKE